MAADEQVATDVEIPTCNADFPWDDKLVALEERAEFVLDASERFFEGG